MKLFELYKPMNVVEIAKKHGVSEQKVRHEVKKGTKIELEHTNSKAEARRIAMDHIAELIDYYDKLASCVED